MNKIFRIVWNEAAQAWVAVSELTKKHKKRASATAVAVALVAGVFSPFAEATEGASGGGKEKLGFDDTLNGDGYKFGLIVADENGKVKTDYGDGSLTATGKVTISVEEANGSEELPTHKSSYLYLRENGGIEIDQEGRSAKFKVKHGDGLKIGADNKLVPDTVDLTVTDGKVTAPNTKDEKKLVNAGNLSNKLNELGWRVSANGGTASTVKSGDEVEFKGDGVTVTTTTETNGKHVVTIKAEKTQGGAAGADGKSAFDTWKDVNNKPNATKEEFLAELKGATGATGADGKSAFDTWKDVNNKPNATKEEFLASLKGDKGESADLPFTKNAVDKSIKLNEEGVIRNVANGRVAKDSKDAVNGSQLHAVERRLSGNMDKLNHRIDKVGKRADAGTASAIATANLLQSYRPGLSAATAAVGEYRGQSAVAVGYSRLSDNGKYGVKLSLGANTQGNVGAGAGVAYFW